MRQKLDEPITKLWEQGKLWELLTDEEREVVNKQVESVNYKKNEIIHLEGDVPTHIMIVLTGKVRIYKEGIGQKPQIIRIQNPGEYFGYRAMIAGDKYNACANAFEPCMIGKLNKETTLWLIKRNIKICYRMMEIMARDLAISELQTVNLTQKHIRGRLAEALLNLKQNHGVESDGKTLNIQISREDIANLSSMTTSNAIRTLSQFAQEKLIDVDGRRIQLLDEEELKRISRLG